MSKNEIKTEDVNAAVFHLVRLKNDEYSIDLTADQAEEMGISNIDYDDFISEIKKTNEIIKTAKSEPDHEVILQDPQKINIEVLQQTMPSGSLSSNGQEQVGAGFFAPFGTKKVRFSCQGGGAPFPTFICRTHSFGITKSKTAVGTFITWLDIDVDIAASNVSVGIDFRTSDSNGGKSNWKAML